MRGTAEAKNEECRRQLNIAELKTAFLVICAARSYLNAFGGRLKRASAGDEVNDQDHHGDDQQQVYQTTGNVETEAQNPQQQQDYEDGPKHANTPC
jgi:hypothetical protein